MAIQKAGESIFSAISNKAVTQIRNREEYTGRSLKTATDLAVLNQNTGWVKVSSGSNILSSNGKRTWSGPARRFILHGGATMTKDQADNLGVNTLRQGINFKKDTNNDTDLIFYKISIFRPNMYRGMYAIRGAAAALVL